MDDQIYFRIRVNSIFPSQPLDFNVYLLINGRYVHYVRTGDHITQEKLSQIQNYNTDAFYINVEDRGRYKDYIKSGIKTDLLNPQEKAVLLRESSFALVEELFENPDVHQALEESKEVINDFIQFMDQEPEGVQHLISLSNHDFYTYTHSLDVSIYSLGLGRVASYKGADLEELGKGALFHDIGKRYVDADIICKKGALDDIEWGRMQKHPQFALLILNDHPGVSDAIKACCFEHHENFLGNGYPQQLSGEDIHPMARIVAITDTYDALTTKRSYNKPMVPRDALTFMCEKLAGRYDPDLLRALNSTLFKMDAA